VIFHSMKVQKSRENCENECLSPQTLNETAFMVKKHFATKYTLVHLWLSLIVFLKPRRQSSQYTPVLQQSYVMGESANYT
jgi:hypothetical protein